MSTYIIQVATSFPWMRSGLIGAAVLSDTFAGRGLYGGSRSSLDVRVVQPEEREISADESEGPNGPSHEVARTVPGVACKRAEDPVSVLGMQVGLAALVAHGLDEKGQAGRQENRRRTRRYLGRRPGRNTQNLARSFGKTVCSENGYEGQDAQREQQGDRIA